MSQLRFSRVVCLSFICCALVGCPGWFGSSAPTTPVPAPTPVTIPGLDSYEQEGLDKALACVLDKTLVITGTYYTSIGAPIGVEREAQLTSALFKVATTGADELQERDSSETRVETWEADFLEPEFLGTEWVGGKEVYCFELRYRRGPFAGPDGQCTMYASGKICENCNIENARWELKCGVDANGDGGKTKATGSWRVKSS